MIRVTQELLDAAVEIRNGWYSTGRIDWPDVWDRLEEQGFDMGDDLLSSQLEQIKRYVRSN
jgi:hypothetical protein